MRKNIKQFILVIISALLLSLYTVKPVYAAGAEFVVSKENAEPGENITISIVNNSGYGLTSGQFEFVFDNERFELVETRLFGKETLAIFKDPDRQDKFLITALPLGSNESYKDEVVVSITFKLKENSEGTANFSLEKARIGYSSENNTVKNLPVNGNSVSVMIAKPNQGGNEDPSVSIPNKTDPDPPQNPTQSDHLTPEPIDPTKPVEPVKPTDPIKPAEPEEPAKPADPVEPTKPVEAVKPIESIKPTEPAKSTNPAKPTEPEKETEPGITIPNPNSGQTKQIEVTKTLKIHVEANNDGQNGAKIISNNNPPRTSAESITESTARKTEIIVVNTDQTTISTTPTNTSLVTAEVRTTTASTTAETQKLTEKNSQNTEIYTVKAGEQKQAKQEQAFELTEDDNGIHNKVIMGGLATIATGSLGTLLFMIIKNHMRPR